MSLVCREQVAQRDSGGNGGAGAIGVLVDRRIEVQPPSSDQLQHCNGGEQLADRGDIKASVERVRYTPTRRCQATGRLEEHLAFATDVDHATERPAVVAGRCEEFLQPGRVCTPVPLRTLSPARRPIFDTNTAFASTQ